MEDNAMYYDGQKILSLKDINGNTPTYFFVDGNRASGKTTYFNKYVFNKFLKTGEKFALLYRFNYELDSVSEKFFKDIQSLFFQDYEMTDKSQSKGMYHELFIKHINDESETPVSCGYAIALNNADSVKKMSHLFSDVSIILFDEFQSETGHYCSNELMKFDSIHASLARGHGKQSKHLPVILLSNSVSIINPYYSALGISERLQKTTKFLRGDGFVLEHNFNESASNAVKNNTFLSDRYKSYASSNTFLNDSNAFIEKITGNGRYIFTLKNENKEYGVIEYPDKGVIYVSDRPDLSFKIKIAVDVNDHDINYLLLSHYDDYINKLRFFFERGCFRFKNQNCKNALMRLLNYKLL